MLYRNGFYPEFVSRAIKFHLNGLKRDKEIGAAEFLITLKIPNIIKRYVYLEKNIKQIISSTFSTAKPRVGFTSSPIIKAGKYTS